MQGRLACLGSTGLSAGLALLYVAAVSGPRRWPGEGCCGAMVCFCPIFAGTEPGDEGMAVMDPISLIVGALAAGAAAGLTDTAAGAVRDAYAGLRDLVRRRFTGRRVAQTALDEHERAPRVWQAPLSAELVAVGADTDAGIVAAAQRVMELVDEVGSASGKYLVDLRGAQGVQVGDRNTQTNTFTIPPGK